MSTHEIGVGTWVVVRDPESVWHDQHGEVTEMLPDGLTRVRLAVGIDADVPLTSLRIPVDGLSPTEKAESDAIDEKLRRLDLVIDAAIIRAAYDASQKVPGLELPAEVLEVLKPLVKLAELAAVVLL